MRFERTADLELVRRILTEPRCYRRIVSDSAPPVEQFAVALPPQAWLEYILATEDIRTDRGILEGTATLALFLLFRSQADPRCAEVHFCVVPEAWGAAEAIVRRFTDWVWETTSLDVLIGKVPSYNRLCLRLAERVGFRFRSVRIAAGTRRNKSFDLLHLELVRPS